MTQFKSSLSRSNPQCALFITVKGTVQGVGFRPFVYRIAHENRLVGEVANTGAGVKILAAGEASDLDNFLRQLRADAPPLAVIDSLTTAAAAPPATETFHIIESNSREEIDIVLPPDMSICDDCLRELFNPADRRYQYPLNNCTNCGPRYTLIRNLPYDRAQTAMAPYPFCEDCLAEYRNPGDRRFHAEATSCPRCGPELQLLNPAGEPIHTAAPLPWLADKIIQGHIVATQGLGGFHIICDATNDSAVKTLRQRKKRPRKPFAVMAGSLAMAEAYGCFNDTSRTLLTSPQRPIVIVPERQSCSPHVSSGLGQIGLFLPYTPLHLLLFEHLNRPLVATSANVAEEPIITDSGNLRTRLGAVIDYSLEFAREIINGCDDSVTTAVQGHSLLLRRARGYAPGAIKLPGTLPHKVLAVGGDMKNTIALSQGDKAILSPHVGDLHSLGAQDYFSRTVATFTRLYNFSPDRIVCDAHPDYFTSRWAARQSLPLLKVQHHYAHALAGMVACDLGPEAEILAICWDGTGYGEDGTLWGGEFLDCSYYGYQRLAHFHQLPLLGGEKAILEPRRAALGLLFQLYGEQALELNSQVLRSFSQEQTATLYQMQLKGLNAPLSSSVGRLFDAAAALLGICQILSYEGESGLRMESHYDQTEQGHYEFNYQAGIIDCSPAVCAMLEETDHRRGATRFINMLAEIIIYVMQHEGRREALVCGGVFQNRCLLERLLKRAAEEMLHIHLPTRVPVNDGCIALGQVAAALSTDSPPAPPNHQDPA